MSPGKSKRQTVSGALGPKAEIKIAISQSVSSQSVLISPIPEADTSFAEVSGCGTLLVNPTGAILLAFSAPPLQ